MIIHIIQIIGVKTPPILNSGVSSHHFYMRPQKKTQIAAEKQKKPQGVRAVELINGGRTPAGVLPETALERRYKGGLSGFMASYRGLLRLS